MNTEPTSEAVRSSDLLGVDLIRAERERQISGEGWTAEHDDAHATGDLARAAACYAMPNIVHQNVPMPNERPGILCGWPGPDSLTWPWQDGWKPSPQDRIRELVKAGALIAAEIDRLDRERRKTPNVRISDRDQKPL